MDIAAFVVACVAALGAAAAGWYTRGEKIAAKRSADAAETSAAEAQRSADTAEEAIGYQRAEVERRRVDFNLTQVTESRYTLSNNGTDDVYGVTVDLGDLFVHGGGTTEFDMFESGHEEGYLLGKSMGTRTTHAVVTWHHRSDQSDEPRTKRLYVT